MRRDANATRANFATLHRFGWTRKVRMAAWLFDPPLFIRRGQQLVEEVTGLDDAFDFLERWPLERQDAGYEVTVKACRDAYCGRLLLETARETFQRFAQRVGILESIENVPAFGPKGKTGAGSGSR